MEESERLRGKGDKLNFIDLGIERGQVAGFWKGRRQEKLHILGRNDDLWERFRHLGSETWRKSVSDYIPYLHVGVPGYRP